MYVLTRCPNTFEKNHYHVDNKNSIFFWYHLPIVKSIADLKGQRGRNFSLA